MEDKGINYRADVFAYLKRKKKSPSLKSLFQLKSMGDEPEFLTTESTPISKYSKRARMLSYHLKAAAKNLGVACLSAPQIGVLLSMFVMLKPSALRPAKWSKYDQVSLHDYTTIANPMVLDYCNLESFELEENTAFEAAAIPAKRSMGAKMQYINENLDLTQEVLWGFKARVFQQMVDQLNGKPLGIDLSESSKDTIVELDRHYIEYAMERPDFVEDACPLRYADFQPSGELDISAIDMQ